MEGARIEYRRGVVTEWYENRPEGLEQGFTLNEKVGGAGALAMLIQVTGYIKPLLAADGQAIHFPACI